MRCVTCDGDGCDACDQTGMFEITDCPKRMVTDDVYAGLTAAQMADKGSWPNVGGWLDQTQSCIEAVRFVWRDENEIQANKLRELR